MTAAGEQYPGLNAVEAAIVSRRSIRDFSKQPVSRGLVSRILEVASRAPSGSNIQPWQVIVLSGAAKDALSRDLQERSLRGDEGREEYAYYPKAWREPYLARRRKAGWGLYGALGIGRGDREAMALQLARNYLFFDAPVGLIFTIDRDMEIGSWLDYGMFLQNIMVTARSHGLDTCPQQSFSKYHEVISARLGIEPTRMVVCGMALGYAKSETPESRFETERAPVSEFARFIEEEQRE